MSVNVSEEQAFRWTRKSEKAALLVAEDHEPDRKIAELCGIAERTLERWKLDPGFRARVADHVAAFRLAIRSKGIAVLEHRVDALNDRWEALRQIARERAGSAEMEHVPGGTTGFVVRTVKSLGAGENFERVELFAVDTGLLRELREHEKQAAQELGQWREKRELSGPDGTPINLSISEALEQVYGGGDPGGPGD